MAIVAGEGERQVFLLVNYMLLIWLIDKACKQANWIISPINWLSTLYCHTRQSRHRPSPMWLSIYTAVLDYQSDKGSFTATELSDYACHACRYTPIAKSQTSLPADLYSILTRTSPAAFKAPCTSRSSYFCSQCKTLDHSASLSAFTLYMYHASEAVTKTETIWAIFIQSVPFACRSREPEGILFLLNKCYTDYTTTVRDSYHWNTTLISQLQKYIIKILTVQHAKPSLFWRKFQIFLLMESYQLYLLCVV